MKTKSKIIKEKVNGALKNILLEFRKTTGVRSACEILFKPWCGLQGGFYTNNSIEKVDYSLLSENLALFLFDRLASMLDVYDENEEVLPFEETVVWYLIFNNYSKDKTKVNDVLAVITLEAEVKKIYDDAIVSPEPYHYCRDGRVKEAHIYCHGDENNAIAKYIMKQIDWKYITQYVKNEAKFL